MNSFSKFCKNTKKTSLLKNLKKISLAKVSTTQQQNFFSTFKQKKFDHFDKNYPRKVNPKFILSEETIQSFRDNGFIKIKDVVPKELMDKLNAKIPDLFKGNFQTGIYPDEWYGRYGMSNEEATKEICNSWKCDKEFASLTLSSALGFIASQLMGWDGARIAQDDVFSKPEKVGKPINFHSDAPYISRQFSPYKNNSVTVWMPTDDVTKENGTLEYVKGSHKWEITDDAIQELNFEFFGPNQDYRAPIYEMYKRLKLKGEPEIHVMDAKKGDIVIHHQDTYHGSDINHSDKKRNSIVSHLLRHDVEFRRDRPIEYTYGRYKLTNKFELLEDFFPITYSKDNKRSNIERMEGVKDGIPYYL